ncbi:RNA-binding protein [Salinicoccus roseus]|uniref:YlmH/Sll1252 family protein n=1 Tax=Salinicoccus roseus TaxID=45670 RepID=A0ABT4YLY7_9STAP|nr:YlmH/Sll1252 family protein [Salinicoccus roseus]MDB0581485.1 YlmH/Sll1252 family protein [Salinicoccus roseus]RPE54535.1 RNA-binding protein YlmH [Salinicoccus roseus]GGA64775.1 S4 RNA-binding protein [Salinicoccus roseus]
MKEIYQHFRKEEHEKITMLNGKFEIAARDYYPILLDFLDPREQMIVTSLAGLHSGLRVEFYGGPGERERQRAMIVPELLEVSEADFEITVFELEYPEKFVKLTHRNILGAVMNVGVDRSLIGDIVVGGKIQFAVAAPYAPLFHQTLTRIRNAPVVLTEVPHESFIEPVDDGKPMSILVASFRLDAIISEVIKEGRAKSKTRVEKGKVKVNHSIVENPSFIMETGDTVSIRHFGRFKVTQLIAETKKGKYRLEVRVYRDG